MTKIITTYLAVLLVLSLGFFGIGTMASAAELRDPMQPPPFALRKFREAKLAQNPQPSQPVAKKPPEPPLRLTSIIYSDERKVAIIDDQMLAIGDRIRGARLVKLTRHSARLVKNGKTINLSLDSELSAIKTPSGKSDL